MRVIINADDFGISARCNAVINEMSLRNRITSATLMANAPYVAEALRLTKHFKDFSLGVHLNLTEFGPLTSTARLHPLLAQNGLFSGNIWQVRFTPRLLCAIVDELGSQIEYVRSHGIDISHLDSHQHIHTIPALFPAVKYLQKKYGIRRIRLSRNFNSSTGQYRGPLLLKKRLYNFALRHIVRSKTTDGFSDIQTFVKQAKSGSLSCRTFEVMVHPGVDDAEDTLVRSAWERELPFDVEFINYHEL